MLQAALVFVSGNANQGFKILETASLKNPDYPGIYVAFARLAVTQQRLTDGIALIEKAQAKVSSGATATDVVKKHFQEQIYDVWIDIGMRRKQYEIVKENLTNLKPAQARLPKSK